MSARDGGPAFPVPDLKAAGWKPIEVNPTTGAPSAAGMSLRDYFAAKAMQGLIAAEPDGGWMDGFAEKRAYRIADAMLAAREKQP